MVGKKQKLSQYQTVYKGLFRSIIEVVFQNIFRLVIHQNNFYFIFKNLFLTSVHQNNPKTLKKINLKLKQIKKILKTQLDCNIKQDLKAT